MPFDAKTCAIFTNAAPCRRGAAFPADRMLRALAEAKGQTGSGFRFRPPLAASLSADGGVMTLMRGRRGDAVARRMPYFVPDRGRLCD